MIVNDSLGKLILAIYQNTWTVYQNDDEYNYDNQAIEIVTNGDRKVYFHVELKKRIAHIEGALYTSKDDTS